ncbi:hypothetical protein AB1Y20_018664 [Prymnesium parvum]|uniref:CAP-Gly domain-containing protein n=1 Tax=Prymnesium parvum TaxID=97485 RepID=A0AB34JSU3_PRYPA
MLMTPRPRRLATDGAARAASFCGLSPIAGHGLAARLHDCLRRRRRLVLLAAERASAPPPSARLSLALAASAGLSWAGASLAASQGHAGERGGEGGGGAAASVRPVLVEGRHLREMVTLLNAVLDLDSFTEDEEHDVFIWAAERVTDSLRENLPDQYLRLCHDPSRGLERTQIADLADRLCSMVVGHVKLPFLSCKDERLLIRCITQLVVASMAQGISLDSVLDVEVAGPILLESFVKGSAGNFFSQRDAIVDVLCDDLDVPFLPASWKRHICERVVNILALQLEGAITQSYHERLAAVEAAVDTAVIAATSPPQLAAEAAAAASEALAAERAHAEVPFDTCVRRALAARLRGGAVRSMPARVAEHVDRLAGQVVDLALQSSFNGAMMNQAVTYILDQHRLARRLRNAPSRARALMLRKKEEIFGMLMRLDVDGDGEIDRTEFVTGMCALDVGLDASDAGKLFDELDIDHSGELDVAEAEVLLFGGQLSDEERRAMLSGGDQAVRTSGNVSSSSSTSGRETPPQRLHALGLLVRLIPYVLFRSQSAEGDATPTSAAEHGVAPEWGASWLQPSQHAPRPPSVRVDSAAPTATSGPSLMRRDAEWRPHSLTLSGVRAAVSPSPLGHAFFPRDELACGCGMPSWSYLPHLGLPQKSTLGMCTPPASNESATARMAPCGLEPKFTSPPLQPRHIDFVDALGERQETRPSPREDAGRGGSLSLAEAELRESSCWLACQEALHEGKKPRHADRPVEGLDSDAIQSHTDGLAASRTPTPQDVKSSTASTDDGMPTSELPCDLSTPRDVESAAPISSSPPLLRASLSAHVRLGDRVEVYLASKHQHVLGTVRYVGGTHFQGGQWIGVELEDAVGRHDGSVDNVRYFKCDRNRGVFVRAVCVKPSQLRKCASKHSERRLKRLQQTMSASRSFKNIEREKAPI